MEIHQLEGLRAVVTGSSRGLGAAVARDLVQRGARVVVNGTDRDRVTAMANELGAPSVVGSVGEEAVAERLVDTCVTEFGGIDLLVNNAGITRDALLTRASVGDFDAVIAVHLRGTWLATRAAARVMPRGEGVIINVVSGSALYGNVGQSAYAAAKGGILALTRASALELRRVGLRVNAISPVVRTGMVTPLLAMAGDLEARFGEPEAVAPVVALLASSAAAGLSGVVLGFDGQRLTAWSHPEAVASVDVTDPSDLEALAHGLDQLPLLTPNPDAFGQAVHDALGVKAGPVSPAAPGDPV